MEWIQSVLRPAEIALHQGDSGPRRALWSRSEPVSVFGAWRNAIGQTEVDALFAYLAGSFSQCVSFDIELLASEVHQDTAYTMALEHTTAVVDGDLQSYSLRVTQVYRREGGQWRVAHRHGSGLPERGA